MTFNGWMQIALFCAIVLALARPLGGFLTRVYAGERTFLHPVLAPVERGFYLLAGVRCEAEQGWRSYAVAMLAFNLLGFLLVYGALRLQGALPLNPQGFAGVTPDLALNTAVSFVTNTNWQSYGGEATMSYGSQMWALTVQNFLSAATGMALAVALIRGFARRSAKEIGNFWTDLTRSILYVLLPLCVVLALVYVAMGVPQTLQPYVTAKTLEGADQTIALGPVASQLAIKMLGTNGGGFFNANSAHPFENPSALANLVQMVSIFAVGAALTNVFGRMVGDERQGWAILGAMGALFLAGVAMVYWAEAGANPIHAALGLDPAGGNMEGKEVRFGIALSALFAVITTAASCGAVIAMHDSFSAIGGMIPMVNMQLGEVIVGGVGAGLYGVLLFAIVAVFVAGLMVGRTPEYVGKKIEGREVKLTMLALLCSPAATLLALGVASVSPLGLAGLQESGPHGFSEMLYATTSAAANNGSAFAGLTANSPFWNVLLAAGMMIGRFALIVPMLAVAGSLAAKGKVPPSAGTFPTYGTLFVGLLGGVILIVGGLTYFPALTLGPVADAFATAAGTTY
ncbi:potassium-transporting ATPase subunit KdpA [Hansschlegelia zhihuaiae]|uniref:Potassium-transporting ATPase potassium-binding subunit n=1 Tax=Hansschlegelia zhihuaiae TaxID=405005 RepID=A0A4Q0MHF1_9HYPH|nr:potassium-transporting ATPase subunit KdpA [Hansschlegelia zhihuaiae]RXF72815.1 potassium-transporting ATPase subunit KdpA [Hansschlegelia zhihuaiae]